MRLLESAGLLDKLTSFLLSETSQSIFGEEDRVSTHLLEQRISLLRSSIMSQYNLSLARREVDRDVKILGAHRDALTVIVDEEDDFCFRIERKFGVEADD